MEKHTIAICYDFDKTLAKNDMQSFSFIPDLGYSEAEFWGLCNKLSKDVGIDSTLSYLKVMIDESKKKGINLTKDYLKSLGKNVKYFEGVTTWFKRINEYADSIGINVEHYIISSGNKEILEGTQIYNEFKEVYGCEFLYDENGIAYWPKRMVNYTLKTQYLFRICKGTTDLTDDEKINQRVDQKRIEFRNFIYLGDGITDIPAMTLIKEKGGKSISIYPRDKNSSLEELVKSGRVNSTFLADYRQGSKLEKMVKAYINEFSIRENNLYKEQESIDKIEG